jgi:hypothetical protein
MSARSIFSLLQLKNEPVLEELCRRGPCTIYTFPRLFGDPLAGTGPDFTQRIAALGSRVVLLDPSVQGEAAAALAAQAGARVAALQAAHDWRSLCRRFPEFALDEAALREVVTGKLSRRLYEAMETITILSSLAKTARLDLVVVNDDVRPTNKVAVLWAKSRGIPTVQLSHSCILGRLIPPHRELNTRTMAVFGEHGAVPYVELGVENTRIAVTGNPAWDVYARLRPARGELRRRVAEAYGFDPAKRLLVFATTWCARLSALEDEDAYESSLRDLFNAYRTLLACRDDLALVVKDRSSNPSGAQRVAEIVAALGLPASSYIYTQDGLAPLIVAADLVISTNSNVSIEAGLAGVPAINLWSPASWLLGPFFSADDGIVEVTGDELARTISRLLSDRPTYEAVQRAAAAALGRFQAVSNGAAASRVAAHLWEQANTPPASGAIALFSSEPRRVIEMIVDGQSGAGAMRERFPGAQVLAIRVDPRRRSLDLLEFGIPHRSVDAVFFSEGLQRLYNPWETLVRLRPFLTDRAQIVATIPSVRNFAFLQRLVAGKWSPNEDGGPAREIRFFTLSEIRALFETTGYRLSRIEPRVDPRFAHLDAPADARVDVDTPILKLKGISSADLLELKSASFDVLAEPVEV